LGADVELKRNHWRKVMTDKFKKVPVDGDTRILSSEERKIGDYDVLIQLWSWDGIMGGSVIFANEDIAGLDEDKIMELAKTAAQILFCKFGLVHSPDLGESSDCMLR
jgi:hypothetical protein